MKLWCCLWAPGCTTDRIQTCRSFWQSTALSSMCAPLPCQALPPCRAKQPCPCPATRRPHSGARCAQHLISIASVHLTIPHCMCVASGQQRHQILLARKSLRKVCWARCHQVLVFPPSCPRAPPARDGHPLSMSRFLEQSGLTHSSVPTPICACAETQRFFRRKIRTWIAPTIPRKSSATSKVSHSLCRSLSRSCSCSLLATASCIVAREHGVK